MDFQLTVHHGQAFLLVVGVGRAMICDLLGAIELVGTVTLHHGDKLAVLDLLAVEIDLDLDDHLTVGLHASRAWNHLERVASVVPQAMRVGTGEAAAREHGLNLRTFTTIADAIAWTTSQPD